MTKGKKFRNQPTVFLRAKDHNMMYFTMGVAIWRDERLNRHQKAILGQILSHNENGDNPYRVNKNVILSELGFNPNNKNNHWNGLVKLGYLKNDGPTAKAKWIIDETKAKDSEWYKKHHPKLEFSKDLFIDNDSKSYNMGVENIPIQNVGIKNNSIQNNALGINNNRNEQTEEETISKENSFFEENQDDYNENPFNVIGGIPKEENLITLDVYGNPLTPEEIEEINR